MKKHKSKNKYIKRKPVLLGAWIGDYYGLGIFCKKTGIVKYAIEQIVKLQKPTEERHLFALGVGAADEWAFTDIAFEIAHLREQTGQRFDAFIYDRAGFEVISEIKDAIKDAHDWETPEQIAIGQQITSDMVLLRDYWLDGERDAVAR